MLYKHLHWFIMSNNTQILYFDIFNINVLLSLIIILADIYTKFFSPSFSDALYRVRQLLVPSSERSNYWRPLPSAAIIRALYRVQQLLAPSNERGN